MMHYFIFLCKLHANEVCMKNFFYAKVFYANLSSLKEENMTLPLCYFPLKHILFVIVQ